LLGFDYEVGKANDYDTRQLTLLTYWRSVRIPKGDYLISAANGGKIFEGSSPATTWLPVTLWKPGQIVKVAFPGLAVNESSDVEVAVTDRSKGSVDGYRLVISETQLHSYSVDGRTALRLFSLHPFLTAPQARPLTEEELAAVPFVDVAASKRSDRSPLCGRPLLDKSLVVQRPVLAKIDNAPQARPQSGLAAACLVYEYMAEGGITRFGAFYHTEDLDTVGPIRSARLMDGELGPAYGAPCSARGRERARAVVSWSAGRLGCGPVLLSAGVQALTRPARAAQCVR
jgi:hypothetical protein